MLAEFTAAVERLEDVIGRNGSKESHQATVHLADHLKSLVQHMRQEQQMVRDWVEDQGEQQTEIRKLLERLSRSPAAAAEKRR
jgi:LPS sulfotransferase NodH